MNESPGNRTERPGKGAMEFALIPWHVFLDTLEKQQPGTLDAWLLRWLFTNEGVIVATPEKYSASSHSPSAAVSAAR